MRKILPFFTTAIASVTLTWAAFATLYKPNDHRYLIAVTSHYFKTMSEAGLNEIAHYKDCRLDEPAASDLLQGVAMFGLCAAENETTKFYYMLAMSSTASFRYSDLEELPK